MISLASCYLQMSMSVKQTMVAVSKSAQTRRVHMNVLAIQAISWLVMALAAMVN